MKAKTVQLPTTLEEFDQLIEDLANTYPVKDKRHAAAVISVAIRHMPTDQGHTTLNYLWGCIVKSLSNHVCSYKNDLIKHETQVEQLENMLRENPNNQQALDELRKAADQGSIQAKATLAKLFPEEPTEPAKVIPIHT